LTKRGGSALSYFSNQFASSSFRRSSEKKMPPSDSSALPRKLLRIIRRINQNARVIAERQISAAPRPGFAAVAAQIKRLRRADVNAFGRFGSIVIELTGTFSGNAGNFLPGFAAVARNQYAGSRRSDPNRFRLLRRRMIVKTFSLIPFAERNFLPAFRHIVCAVNTVVGSGENAVFAVFGVS
jgi:hypothetical protein